MRYIAFGLCGILLGGCALPLPIKVASWAASGISYAATGKGVSDHAVSAMVEKDCALHRVALGEDVCIPEDVKDDAILVADRGTLAPSAAAPTPSERLRESMIALANNLDSDLTPASGPENSAEIVIEDDAETEAPVDTALLALAETLNDIAPAAAPAAEPAHNPDTIHGDGKHYLVIGQFRQLRDAQQARGRHTKLQTAVRMVLREGALLYMVTAGPFKRPDALEIGAALATKGKSPEIALLCADRVSPPPCHSDAAPTRLTQKPLQLTQNRTR